MNLKPVELLILIRSYAKELEANLGSRDTSRTERAELIEGIERMLQFAKELP